MWFEKLPFVRVIYNFGRKYLTRIYLWRSKRFTLYLHIFHQPDPGRDLHNHPWDYCWSMCLWGGYEETMFVHGKNFFMPVKRAHMRYAMVPRKFSGALYHAVSRLNRKRVVTLFAHGKRVREWGFWKDGKHVPWHKYLVDEGINSAAEIETLKARYADE
jgi:hypothetical protein